MHGVQVVHEAFHGLERVTFNLLSGANLHTSEQLLNLIQRQRVSGNDCFDQSGIKFGRVFQLDLFTRSGFCRFHERRCIEQLFLHFQLVFQGFLQTTRESLAIGLTDTVSHAVVEVRDGLTTVLVVLVGLDGNGGQGSITLDAVGFAQIAVTRGETTGKQALDVDLTARRRQGVEVEIVDVDVAFTISLGVFRTQQIQLVIGLGTGRTDLQHATHGGVTVDVSVVTLHVALAGIDVRDFINRLHQRRAGFTSARTVGAVKNVGFSSTVETVVHELMFNSVLDRFNVRGGATGETSFQITLHVIGNACGIGSITLGRGFQCTKNRRSDLVLVKKHDTTVALGYAMNHGWVSNRLGLCESRTTTHTLCGVLNSVICNI